MRGAGPQLLHLATGGVELVEFAVQSGGGAVAFALCGFEVDDLGVFGGRDNERYIGAPPRGR